jgi:Pyruvate/2-oxoacid:ferredoxin oxidoreductase delta subunit
MNVRDAIQSALRESKGGLKNTRDAFLYFNHRPNSPKTEFAQCVTCRMFVPDEYMGTDSDMDLCVAHGSNVKVGEEYSCGLYSGWPKGPPNPQVIRDHAAELKKGIPGSVTPKESGLVERKVRCENCAFFDKNKCRLYMMLNKTLPNLFDLDENVEPYGCCNANIERLR